MSIGTRRTAAWFLILFLAEVSALHVASAIHHWPFPTSLARYAVVPELPTAWLNHLSALLFLQSMILLILSFVGTAGSLVRGVAIVAIWSLTAVALYLRRWASGSMMAQTEPILGQDTLIAGMLVILVNAALVYLRWKKHGGTGALAEVVRSDPLRWGAADALILFLLAFNIALIALPRIAFIISPPPLVTPLFDKGVLQFRYMDVVNTRTPLFYLGQKGIRLVANSYLTNHLFTLSLTVVAAVLFSVAVSQLWGWDLALVTCVVIVTDCWFMKLAYSGNNAGTLLLPCAVSILFLTSMISISGSRSTAAKIGIFAGIFIGALLCLIPYVYSPARVALGLIGLLAMGVTVVRVWRSTKRQLLQFALLLVLPSLLPGAAFMWAYDWRVSQASHDFQGNAYNLPALKLDGKPESLGIENTISPDLPIWAGFTASFHKPGSAPGERMGVYWNRPPAELLEALRIHWRHAWRESNGSLPGPAYAEILFVAGLSLLVHAWGRPLRDLFLICFMCVALVSPYLLVGSPLDLRRGAAMLLPFSLGIAVPFLLIPRWVLGVWIRDKRHLRYASVVAGVIAVLLIRYPRELAQISQEGLEIGMVISCGDFPIRELLVSAEARRLAAGEVSFLKQGDERCLQSALATIEIRRALHNPTMIEMPSREEFERQVEALQPLEYVVLNCGASARTDLRVDNLCASDVVRQHTAFVVPAPPRHSDAVWTILD